jgi:hypothetical protein
VEEGVQLHEREPADLVQDADAQLAERDAVERPRVRPQWREGTSVRRGRAAAVVPGEAGPQLLVEVAGRGDQRSAAVQPGDGFGVRLDELVDEVLALPVDDLTCDDAVA